MPNRVVDALVSGGAGAWAGGSRYGLAGAVVGGIIGFGAGLFGGRRDDQAARILREYKTTIRSAVQPASWVVGRARIGGQEVYATVDPIEAGDMVWSGGQLVEASRPGKVLRRVFVLSHGQLSAIPDVYIDGARVPLSRASYAGAVHGEALWSDIDAIQNEILDLENRLDAFNYRPELGPQTRAATYSPVVLDLANQLAALQQSRDRRWGHRVGGMGSTLTSTVNVFTDLGASGVSAADVRMSQAVGPMSPRASAGDLENPPDYDWDGGAGQLVDLAWCMVEFLSFDDGPDWGPAATNVQFLCDSGLLGGAYTENPAAVAEWLLTERMGVPSTDIVGATDAKALCDQDITLSPVSSGTQNTGNDFTLQDLYDLLWASGILPSQAILDAVLGEWNRRFAGAGNAEKRFQCHGVITAEMLRNPAVVLRELGQAMGGWIAVTGGKYNLIPGDRSSTVVTLTVDDLVSIGDNTRFPVWKVGVAVTERIRSVRGELEQDKEADYTRSRVDDAVNEALLAADGFTQLDIGSVPFQNSTQAAARLMDLELRRAAPTLLRGDITVGPGDAWANFGIEAGDRVMIAMSDEGVTNPFLVERVEKSFDDETVNLIIREDPDDIYGPAPRKLLTTVGQVGTFGGTGPANPVILTAPGTTAVEYDEAGKVTDQDLGEVFRVAGVRATADSTLVYRVNDGDWMEVAEQAADADDATVPFIEAADDA